MINNNNNNNYNNNHNDDDDDDDDDDDTTTNNNNSMFCLRPTGHILIVISGELGFKRALTPGRNEASRLEPHTGSVCIFDIVISGI